MVRPEPQALRRGDQRLSRALEAPGGPDRVSAHRHTDELEATVAGVRAAGGVISQEPYDFPGGRRFHFRDPAGNELGVWSTS